MICVNESREGSVAARPWADVYSGSRPNGSIYAVDLRTGEGAIVVPPQEGRVAVGVAVDERTNYIFVAGGATGDGYVYDANTGESLAAFSLTTDGATFINDVVVTTDAAYFTESNQAVIYRVPLGRGGSLSSEAEVEAIPLTGDWQQVTGLNANGIEATPDGSALLIINSASACSIRWIPPRESRPRSISAAHR